MTKVSRAAISSRVVSIADFRSLSRRRLPKAVFDYLDGGAEGAIDRARAAGFSGLVVTIDTPVAGMRERDFRNGVKELLSGSLLAKARFLPEIVTHPGWLAGFLLDGGVPKLPNVVIPGRGPMPLVDVSAALTSSAV